MSDSIAILLPCLNEADSIGAVVDAFRRAAPDAAIHVIDNGSTDGTGTIARAHGAMVIVEPRRGKGRALRTAFRVVDADIFVLADGDGQAEADRIDALLAPLRAGDADMVVGSRRLGSYPRSRRINRLGNAAFTLLLRLLLRARLTDVLSGYRAVRAEMVRTLPLTSSRFEIEAELTIRAVQAGYRVVDVPITAAPRAAGNAPRLRVVSDGLRILASIVVFVTNGRPLRFLAVPGIVLLGAAALVAVAGRDVPGGLAVAVAVLAGIVGLGLVVLGLALLPTARSLRTGDDVPEPVPGANS